MANDQAHSAKGDKMKFKTTKKEIMNGYYKVIKVGYCSLQHLLNYENEIAYTTRVEGWGADIYQFGSVAIVTGYAPFGNVVPSYEINKKYDDMAITIMNNSRGYKDQLSELIKQYIDEVTV